VRRRQSFGGVGRRHPDVDDHQIGLVLAHEVDEVLRIAGLTGDLKAGLLEQPRETLAQEDIVVRDDDAVPLVRGRFGRCATLSGRPPAVSSMAASRYTNRLVSRIKEGALVGWWFHLSRRNLLALRRTHCEGISRCLSYLAEPSWRRARATVSR
jgi:hypothetical protein